jgi:hypothetical protein
MITFRRSFLAMLRAATATAVMGLPGLAQAQLTTHTTEASWQSAVASPTLIDFDGLADGTPVALQYAGLSFSAFNGGNPLAVAYNFSQAGANLLSLGTPPLTGGGGGVAVDFSTPRQGVGFWYLDSEIAGNSVAVYGAGNQRLGTFELAFPHPAEWVFVGFSSTAHDISRIEVTVAAADMVALDSLQFAAAVPEPQTWAMLLAGLVWVGGVARTRAVERGTR